MFYVLKLHQQTFIDRIFDIYVIKLTSIVIENTGINILLNNTYLRNIKNNKTIFERTKSIKL